jgi:PAS domain S-box-containing protein
MIWDRTNRPVWLRYAVGVLLAVIAAAIRFQFFGILELRAPFVTFYPAVMVAALYGGLGPGLLATVISAALADYFWIEPVGQFAITNFADLISFVIFLSSGALISYLAEATYRAQARARAMEAQAKLAVEQEFHLFVSEVRDYAIFMLDTAGCVVSWNMGAEQIKGYRADEIIGRSHSCFYTPEDNAREWPAQLLHRAASEGRIEDVGWRVRKDGSRFWADVVVTALHDKEGSLRGFSKVTRDITERERAEEALRRSEERFRVTLGSIGDAVIATDASGLVTFINSIGVELTGWQSDEALHQPVQNIFRIINEKTCQPALNVVERVLREGNIVNLANHTALITRDGREFPIEDSAAPIRDSAGGLAGVVLVFHDVTEKRRAQDALRQQADLLRLSFDAIIVWRLGGNIEIWNHGAEELYGFDETEAIGCTTHELLHTTHPVPWPEIEATLLETGRWEGEARHRAKDGREVVVSTRHQLVQGDDGVQRVLETNRDITEHKKMEEELLHLNRTLRALSNTNQATIHSEDVSELLDAVCRIIVRDCGHPMVWIGFAEDDEEKTVKPVAQAGFEEGYLDKIKITWSDTELGRGPTGIAIRTGEPDVCRNMVTEPRMQPWREQAIKRGYASSVAVPLRADERTFGVLTIYSKEPDSFSSDEVKLLAELADDLAYGITALRLRLAHQQSEKELRESQARLDLALRSAHMGVWHWDIIENRRWFDDQVCNLLGINPAEFTGASVEFFKAVHPEDRFAVREALARVIEQDGLYEMEYRAVWPDSSVHHVTSRGRVVRDDIGRPVRLNGIIWDITERKLMEEDLRKSRDELEFRVQERTSELNSANEDLQKQAALLNLARDAIFVRGLDHTVQFWNEGAAELYGFTRQEALGKVTQDLLRTGFRESIDQIVDQVLASGWWEGELQQTTSTGKEILVESRWALQRGTDGEPLGFLEINRDTTARKLAEEALRSNMARLELVNAELQEFAHVASHDLQEPLRKIQTFCDMARKRCAPVLDTVGKDYLDRIVNSANRMRQLLSDLLDFSRVATRLEPFKKIDLVKIVLEAADVFEASVKETGSEIDIENIPAIEADETQMLRLFQNLIGNALKFRSGETPKVKVHGKLVGRRLCEILVEDNGIGFDPKFAELIFKPFQRLHGRSEYDGTGMGLSICRKIVERHGGSIRAESEPGTGSTFIIRLPVKQDRWEGV